MRLANVFRYQSWWSTAAWVAVGTAAAYGALLGWDQDARYDDWQVALVILIMGCLAVWAGRRRAVWLSSFAATAVMTVLWSIDAATDARNDGLWPVGAIGVLVGTGLGFTVVAVIAASASRWPGAGRGRVGWVRPTGSGRSRRFVPRSALRIRDRA